MSILSVLCYSEKMFHAAFDVRDGNTRSRVQKRPEHKQFTDRTNRWLSPRRTTVPTRKTTSPVVHVSITSGL